MATTDPKSIVALVERINTLATSFSAADGFADKATRTQFVDAAEQLTIAARYPQENIFFTLTRTMLNAAIQAACALGIFAVVPAAPGAIVSARDLAAAVRADRALVVRIMRVLVSCHIFTEAGEALYTHNALSRVFLVPECVGEFSSIYETIGKGVYALPEFLARTGWKNAEDYDDSAFHLGAHTKLGYWEYLEANPVMQQAFNTAMRSQATAQAYDSSYPFQTELNAAPVKDDDVVLVDVGGGRGQALERIKHRFPSLKGRLVLQDQDAVIKDAIAGGLSSAIETQAASFFAPNPVKNARAYLFRRVLHDWSDSVCRKMLSNTVASMGPESRLLIAEFEIPVVAAPAMLALSDITMMAFGGTERTEQQFSHLLDSVGLAIVKVWRSEGTNFVVIEGRLKGV